MIIINTKLITELDLTLDSISEIREKDEKYKKAKKKIKFFEKKYGYNSKLMCAVALSPYVSEFDEKIFRSINKKDRTEWWKCMRLVVASSWSYKFWIAFFELIGLTENE